jgi:hypothetical protein
MVATMISSAVKETPIRNTNAIFLASSTKPQTNVYIAVPFALATMMIEE